MVRVFFKKNYYYIVINAVIIIAFILGYGHFGDINFDSFREAYIPNQILNGEVLYKNIFNIYAPFAYLFNALIFKIFGTSLNTLYIAGLIATLVITNLINKISNLFFNKHISISIVIFFIANAVLSANVFNCFLPYSYGMLYGLLFILSSIYFCLNKQFSLSYLMYSFAICSKYEFILFLPILIIASWKNKSWKHIIAFFIPIVVTFLPLAIQKVDMTSLIISFKLMSTMTTTKTIYWFYKVTGLIFTPQLLPIYLINLLKISIPIFCIYFIKRIYFVIPFILIYGYYISTPEIFMYIFPLICILFVLRFKYLNHNELLFILASLLISLKVFFGFTMQSYGIYFIPFGLISLFILTPSKIRKALLITILSLSFCFGLKNIKSLKTKTVKLESEYGITYVQPYYGNSIKELNNYINKNTSINDKILVFPECLAINFLTNRSSDNKFFSLIPLYIETFGEDLIIKRLQKTQPEYIIISNVDTSSYYYTKFGQDYGLEIMKYIKQNYSIIYQTNTGIKFLLYMHN